MNDSETVSNHLTDIIEIARLSPSVHNSQPWKVSSVKNIIHINIDKLYRLKQGDPTGRQTFISLGIFSEAIVQEASIFGYSPNKIELTENGATIDFIKSEYKNAVKNFQKLITNRASDRSIYSPVKIKDEIENDLKHLTTDKSLEIVVIKDPEKINKTSYLTSKGIGLALKNPDFRKELKRYLILPWSRVQRGISVKSLYINPILEILQPLFMQIGLGLNNEVSSEYKRWKSASAIIVILSSGDFRDSWYEAGRSYLLASLLIESAGLSQATSAAIVEAADFHEDFEKLLNTKKRVQAMIRIGKGSGKRYYSPRVPTNDLLTLH